MQEDRQLLAEAPGEVLIILGVGALDEMRRGPVRTSPLSKAWRKALGWVNARLLPRFREKPCKTKLKRREIERAFTKRQKQKVYRERKGGRRVNRQRERERGREEGEKRERRGREEGEKRERRGREEGEKRERRGREEGEKRERRGREGERGRGGEGETGRDIVRGRCGEKLR